MGPLLVKEPDLALLLVKACCFSATDKESSEMLGMTLTLVGGKMQNTILRFNTYPRAMFEEKVSSSHLLSGIASGLVMFILFMFEEK